MVRTEFMPNETVRPVSPEDHMAQVRGFYRMLLQEFGSSDTPTGAAGASTR